MHTDKLGRVINRWFDKYGEPQFSPNTPEANRTSLIMERTKPSKRPKGGNRGKPKKVSRP